MQPPKDYKPVRFKTAGDLRAACKGKLVHQNEDGEMIFRDASNQPIVYVRDNPNVKVNLKYFTPIKY